MNSLSFRLTAGRPDLQEMANTVGKLFSPSLPGVPAILPSAPLPAFSGARLRVSAEGTRLVNWRFGPRRRAAFPEAHPGHGPQSAVCSQPAMRSHDEKHRVQSDKLVGTVSDPRRQYSDRKSTRLNSSHRCISYAV